MAVLNIHVFLFFVIAATNTETVCDSGVVRHLLGILQWEGLDGHAQLSIVMCLSMLTEDRGTCKPNSQVHLCVCVCVCMCVCVCVLASIIPSLVPRLPPPPQAPGNEASVCVRWVWVCVGVCVERKREREMDVHVICMADFAYN